MSPARPAFFDQIDDNFIPRREAANPWFDNAVAGGPLTGLFGHIAESGGMIPHGFSIARMTIDILGIVPSAPLQSVTEAVRDGRQMKLHRITLSHAGRPVAQALILAARTLETPAKPLPHDHPAVEDVPQAPFLANGSLQQIVRTRPITGGVTHPGRGVVWLTLDADIVSGTAASPFTRACVFADFGNGVGSATHAQDWSFANLDVGVQFLREPVGEWVLLDADTLAGGNGHALAQTIMADSQGVFAIATQTIFVAPGAATPRMIASREGAVA